MWLLCTQYVWPLLILPCFMTLCWKSCPTSIVKPPSLTVFKVQCLVPLCQSPSHHHRGPLQHLWPHSCLLLPSINTMLSWACCSVTPIIVSRKGEHRRCVVEPVIFARHFRKLFGDCPLSGSWLCCGRSWTQRGLSSQGGEVGMTSKAGRKDVKRCCQSGSVYARLFEDNYMIM